MAETTAKTAPPSDDGDAERSSVQVLSESEERERMKTFAKRRRKHVRNLAYESA